MIISRTLLTIAMLEGMRKTLTRELKPRFRYSYVNGWVLINPRKPLEDL